ncbi:MAG: hypothetical protein ACPGIC_07215 [Opitutales bacterium]
MSKLANNPLVFQLARVLPLVCGMALSTPDALAQSLQSDDSSEDWLQFECRILSFTGNVQGLSEADILAGKTFKRPETDPLYYASGPEAAREFHPLRLRHNKLGPVLSYEGPGPFQLYRKEQVDGTTQMLPVVRVDAAELPSSSVLLVLSRSSAGGYRYVLVDNSAQRVPPAHLLLLNLSEFPVAASTGEEPRVVDPLASACLMMNRRQAQRFNLKLAIGEPAGWKPIYASKVTVADDRPILALVHRAKGELGEAGSWTVRFLQL